MSITIEVYHILIFISVVSLVYANYKSDPNDYYFGGVFEFFLFSVGNLIMWLIYFIIN